MNQGYARTYHEFWTGATGIKLASCGDEGARSLAHFLISGPNCLAWGLFYKPIEVLVHEFKRPTAGDYLKAERDVRRWLDILSVCGYADFDEDTGFVWVREMAAFQFRPLPWKPTNLLIKSARRWYGHVTRNRFLGPYFDRYDIDLHLSNPFAFPGTEVPRREWAGTELQAPLLDISPPKKTQALELRRPAVCGEAEFNEWWEHYPRARRKARKVCLTSWLKKRIPVAKLPHMIDLLEAQKRTHDWRKNQGQYVPLPLTYINQERYDDESPGMSHGGLNPTNEVTANTLAELLEEMPPDVEYVHAGARTKDR